MRKVFVCFELWRTLSLWMGTLHSTLTTRREVPGGQSGDPSVGVHAPSLIPGGSCQKAMEIEISANVTRESDQKSKIRP